MIVNGDLIKIKQIFAYVNQENISVEELGVPNNEFNQGQKQTLADYSCVRRGITPLILAAWNGHHQVCDYLITEQKANLETRDNSQRTALTYAAFTNKTDVLKVLVKNNASVKARNSFGNHAAYLAAEYGYLDALKILVEKDGDVIDLKGPNGETPLIAASRRGWVDVCKYLVEEKNANINLEDDNGMNSLQHATNYNEYCDENYKDYDEILRYFRILKLLRSKGAE